MADDAVIDLSMLLENGLIAQFEEYEIPKDTSAEFILEGLLRTVGRILKQREDLGPLPSMIVALQKLVDQIQEKSLPRSKMIRYIALFEGLIYCIDDTRLQNAKPIMFNLFTSTLNLFDFTEQYLLIKRLFKQVADGEIKVMFEPQVLAWIIDLYRQRIALENPEAQIFRNELTFFYADISKVHYKEVKLCFQYLISVALLVQLHASINFDKTILKAAKAKVLDEIYTQVNDFRTLEKLRGKDDEQPFEHMEFLLFILNNAMRVIDKAIREFALGE